MFGIYGWYFCCDVFDVGFLFVGVFDFGMVCGVCGWVLFLLEECWFCGV